MIIGDANLAEISGYLKVGTTSLVLAMIESGFIDQDLGVRRPVQSLHEVSHDPTLAHLLELGDGRRLTAVQLQWEYLTLARKYVEERLGGDADEQTLDVLQRWESVLDRLERDPFECARASWTGSPSSTCCGSTGDRDGLEWSDAKLALIDLQYSDLRPDKGLYQRLVRLGRIERLLTDEEVTAAMYEPPGDTRAFFRGRCLDKYADNVAAASWDSVIFELPGYESLQRVPTIDPRCARQPRPRGGPDRFLRRRAEPVPGPDEELTGRRSGRVESTHLPARVCDQWIGFVSGGPGTATGHLTHRPGTRPGRPDEGARPWPRSTSSRDGPPRRRSLLTAPQAPEAAVSERKEQLDDDIDAILGDIDDVLETNAEDFVKSFIQKGGQ